MSTNSLGNLSQMTGLSPAELAKRAEQLVDKKTGKINVLSALDAALVLTGGSAQKTAAEAFAAMGAVTASTHVIEDPQQAYTHGAPFGGYAPEAPQAPQIGGPLAQLEKGAKSGVAKMTAFCGAATPPPPPAPEPPPEQPAGPLEAGGNSGACGPSGCEDPAQPGSNAPLASSPLPAQPSTPAAPTGPAAPGGTVGKTLGSAGNANVDNVNRSGRAPPPRFGAGNALRPGMLTSSPAPGAITGQAAGGRMTGQLEQGGRTNPDAPSATTPARADTAAAQGQVDSFSRDIQFEQIKIQVQRMAEVQNAVTNVMNAMHEQGMTAIRNAKAS